MKCKDIASVIEKLAPKNLAYDWDNVGLLVGDGEQEVKRVLVTLDLDIDVVMEAKAKGAQMIVGHHPIMFDPINKITEQTSEGKVLRALIKNDIAYYAAHTNLDVAKGGLNDLLAKKLRLCDTKILECIDAAGEGIGRIGYLKEPITLFEFVKIIKSVLGAEYVRYSGESDERVQKVAVNTGGGTSLIDAALRCGADVFVTGDYKYAQIRRCKDEGMKIIDVGHYDTEIIACELFESYLKEQLSGEIEVTKTETNKNVMKFM